MNFVLRVLIKYREAAEFGDKGFPLQKPHSSDNDIQVLLAFRDRQH